MQTLISKIFKNEFVRTFDGDESGEHFSRQTPGVLYSKVLPTPVPKPALLAWSDKLSEELRIKKPQTQEEVDVLAGNLITGSMYPYAACYAGHQFGNWAGQLGDGRAITLGEWDLDGITWELQLKGAGPTPYSRRADGRAVLRSSVREYLMSEAMHHLGVPTTRALSLVSTGEPVLRDMFYNGNAAYEPGAIVMRAAPSFLRFGNFEMLAAREEIDNLKKLAEWTIAKFYPHITGQDKILVWFNEVIERTILLMVEWLRVGFVHGVMNTDNMSILGLTIDYGPYSFMDDFDLNFTPNTTDLPGRRYAFGNQAYIAYWNLGCLANAIAPLLHDTDPLVAEMETYQQKFLKKYLAMMGNKLGLDEIRPGDSSLVAGLEQMMDELHPDMTIFYQLLADLPRNLEDSQEISCHFKESFYNELTGEESERFANVIKAYLQRVNANRCTEEHSLQTMRRHNPRFILRNYLLHQAIEALEKGDTQLFEQLEEAIHDPYSRNFDRFFEKRPSWATRKAGCSMLSCSS